MTPPMTLQEAKAAAYDLIAELEAAQRRLAEMNQRIAALQQQDAAVLSTPKTFQTRG